MLKINQIEIEKLECGGYLDSLIEYYVFDKTKSMYFKPGPYSSDLLAAWQVFLSEKFITREINLSDMNEGYQHLQYTCRLTLKENVWKSSKQYGSTAPEAICKAALLALAVR
nr:hypothetical protein [Mycobacterium sp. E3298]